MCITFFKHNDFASMIFLVLLYSTFVQSFKTKTEKISITFNLKLKLLFTFFIFVQDN